MSLECVMKRIGMVFGLAAVVGMGVTAGAQSEVHGRKWKPLPATSHVVVTVLKGFNGKPLPNAAVVFHAVRDGKNDGNLEVKTDNEGKATIDVIEMGSHLTVQVIANGFATQALDFDVDGPSKEVEMKLLRPRAQVSVYADNDGKASTEKPGVQEPPHPVKTITLTTGGIVKPAGTPTDPTKPTAEPVPTSGPLSAQPGAITVPTQPGAPVTVLPPTGPAKAAPPQTGSSQSGSPQ